MRIDKFRVYAIEFALLTLLSFALFVPNVLSKHIIAVALIISSAIAGVCIKARKVSSINSKKVNKMMIAFGVIYLVGFYVMGIYLGFYKSGYKFGFSTIINHILPMAIIIATSEYIRKIFLSQNIKYSSFIAFIITVLIDIIIYYNVYTVNTYSKMLEVIGYSLLASIACNLLYNYISNRYGMKPNVIFRLITVLYVFIIPVIPNVYLFFRSVLRVIYPFVIYYTLEYSFTVKKIVVSAKSKKRNTVIFCIVIAIAASVVALVSCQFKVGALVVGSESMTGAINKGDVIIVEKNDDNDEIEVGQIIVFSKNNVKIVHRVIEIKNINGEKRYITKGDINQKEDEGYVTEDEIIGLCKLKIKYIGYPSIWIRDIFKWKGL